MQIDISNQYIYTNFQLGIIPPIQKTSSIELNLLYQQMLDNFLKNINRSHIVVMLPGRLQFFKNLSTNISSILKKIIDNNGLDIHLFDIPSLYHKDRPTENILYYNFEDNDVDNILCHEFESISLFVKNNNLKNVNVYCNAHNIKKFSYKYPNLNLYCTPIGWQYPTTWNFNFIEPDSLDIKKHFWCGNWKYTEHRHIVSAFFGNCLQNTNLSWFYNKNIEYLESRLWFDIKTFKHNDLLVSGNKILEDNSPIVMDDVVNNTLTPHSKDIPNIDHSIIPTDYYNESFCAVVTETRFAQPFAALTEKTMQAIIHARPFIMVAPPFTLKYAKDMGWKSFDKWFDESYDNETNHQKRLEKILDLLLHINSLPINDLRSMYNDMTPTLLHNQKQLRNLQKIFKKNNIDTNPYFRKLRCS